jgi:hypothetical protein
VGADIRHPNGNVYDQVLLQGAAATITADPGQVTRVSYLDLNEDIVQVEFAGAGSLTLTLENATGPAAPRIYHQPDVLYMRGHGSIVITGADETTNVAVFCVGRATAFNPALFLNHSEKHYEADLHAISILSANGKFGGVRTANAFYFGASGMVGIYAPNVQFTGPVYVYEIHSDFTATSALLLGASTDVRITGGNLMQITNRAVQVSGITQLKFTDGTSAEGMLMAAQKNTARLQDHGVDVTDQVTVNPAP